MTHTEPGTMQQILHREVAGTIALLADEEDFSAMRRYRTFTFHDHRIYLRQTETLLRTLAAEGRHTSVALFDPKEYEEYCTGTGLDPDTPISRTRFTAELAATGTTLPYEGQPFTDLVPDLVATALRHATWEYATTLLAGIGACATCGEDIGWSSYTRASDLVVRVLDRAGPGRHHLVCSVSTPAEPLLSVLDVVYDDQGGAHIGEVELREFATVLATGIATRAAGGLVVRTLGERRRHDGPDRPDALDGRDSTDGADGADAVHGAETRRRDDGGEGPRDRVYGWRLSGWNLRPLTASEVFDAYCTDVESGDLISPEPGVDYIPPPDIGQDEPPAGHMH